MEKYFILDKDGILQGVSNELLNKDILYTTIDYADFVNEVIAKGDELNLRFDFENNKWINLK